MYNNTTLGKVRLQATPNGYCLRARYLPIYNDGFTWRLGLHTCLYWQYLLLQHHGKTKADYLKKMDDSTILAFKQIFVSRFSCNKR